MNLDADQRITSKQLKARFQDPDTENHEAGDLASEDGIVSHPYDSGAEHRMTDEEEGGPSSKICDVENQYLEDPRRLGLQDFRVTLSE